MNENEIRELIRKDKTHLWHPFTQQKLWEESQPLMIVAGEGCYLIGADGRRYFDGVSSLWCNVHGHRRKEIDDAIRAQLGKIAHSTLLGLASDVSAEFAAELVRVAPAGLTRVFYSDSGSTAVEIALKMAYQFHQQNGASQRRKFIAFENAYHGDTVGSVSVGGIDLFHKVYRDLLFEKVTASSPHFYRAAKVDESQEEFSKRAVREFAQIFDLHADECAAVIIEPLMQGAAGMIAHPPGFLRAVRDLTSEREVFLIVDEVATGFGRTGKMFACEYEGVSPDMMCVAKGITGGYLPLAATLTTEAIYEGFKGELADLRTFFHGHTYTGNALASAAGLASLRIFEADETLAHVKVLMETLARSLPRLLEHENVGDIRRVGLMTGIELVKDKRTKEPFEYERAIAAEVCMKARSHGVVIRNLGNVIVLMPPLGSSVSEIANLVDTVKDSIREVL
ncbi:MAG: adenosylmethionine--8-amino-7-oxononanoate transaminase [Planctomycetes bacterium]|nr:adenosylmethionine--8-amino-7-oxononanoate transaminase [Planctomycetota bacterium]